MLNGIPMDKSGTSTFHFHVTSVRFRDSRVSRPKVNHISSQVLDKPPESAKVGFESRKSMVKFQLHATNYL